MESERGLRRATKHADHGTIRVLMLDDDRDVREAIKTQLRELGCAVEQSHLETTFAVDVAPERDAKAIVAALLTHEASDAIEFEEGCKTW